MNSAIQTPNLAPAPRASFLTETVAGCTRRSLLRRSRLLLSGAMLLGLSGGLIPGRMMAQGQNATVSVGHSKRALPSTPEELVKAFAVHFNLGEQERLLALYDSKAVFVPAPGKPVNTPDGIRGAVRQWIDMRVPIQIAVRHVYQSGDFALVVSDWTLSGKTSSGEALELAGTATDVLRRTKSGGWLYVVDNPFGGQHPAASQTSK